MISSRVAEHIRRFARKRSQVFRGVKSKFPQVLTHRLSREPGGEVDESQAQKDGQVMGKHLLLYSARAQQLRQGQRHERESAARCRRFSLVDSNNSGVRCCLQRICARGPRPSLASLRGCVSVWSSSLRVNSADVGTRLAGWPLSRPDVCVSGFA